MSGAASPPLRLLLAWLWCSALLGAQAAQPAPARPAPPPAAPVATVPAAAPQSPAAAPQDEAVAALLAPERRINADLQAELDDPDGLVGPVGPFRAQIADVGARLAALRAGRERVEARILAAGSTESVGLLLWRERARAPDQGDLAHDLARLQQQASALQLRMLEAGEQRQALDDLQARIAEWQATLPAGLSSADRAAADAGLRALLQQRRLLLDEVVRAGDTAAEVLLDLEQLQRTLNTEALGYRESLDTHVMWLHSATPLSVYDLPQLAADGGAALRWLVNPGQWRKLFRVLLDDARAHALRALLGALAFGTLLLARSRLRRRIELDAERVLQPATDAFRHTLDSALCTLLVALPWPLLAWWISRRLEGAEGSGPFEHAISGGLQAGAVYGFWLSFGRRLCRPRGLGEAHFRWPAVVTAALRRNLRVLTAVWLPAVCLVATFAVHGNESWSESLGRAAFVVAGVVMAAVLWRLLRQGGAVMATLQSRRRTGWVWSLRHAWRFLLVMLPLLYVALSLGGYDYTALALQRRVHATVALCVAVGVLYALLLRWLYIMQLNLLAERRRLRRAAAEEGAEGEQELAAALADEHVVAVNTQTRKFARAALAGVLGVAGWFLWVDVLPAFSVLDEIVLWHHAANESAPILGSDGQPKVDAAGKPQLGIVAVQRPVTLMNLLAALLIGVALVIVERNVSGLLELSVLRRLPVSASGRYAIRTLARYAIVMGGLVGIFGALGVAWGDVQWLAAAITVGLGFGLQEIFANFVAGVILLLERPIRVGDTVTVGGVSGSVSRIRMRATTITDLDRRELLVPNKEFITGQVVNWTLSDDVLRAVIKVGVAYGSDTGRVCSILVRLARASPLVLARPEPMAYFDSFGESALNFELRVFVESPEHQRAIRHELNLAIDAAFREAGIEIAFPQRDIHLRSLPPEWGPRGA